MAIEEKLKCCLIPASTQRDCQKEILLTSSRQGVQWNKACREEGGEGKGGGALNYRGTHRHVRLEDIEQLEDGPDA